MPFRVDKGKYSRAEKLDNGFLRADAVLTRTGVFVYRDAGGNERRELRLPDEVFAQDSLRTLELVPVTLEHPGAPVTTDNARLLQVGTVGSDVRRDGDNVEATIMLTDGKAIQQAESGERRDVSCGYWTDLDSTPGSYHGEHYDCIQRNIRYNHVALTRDGRAGNARLHLDSDGAEMIGSAAVANGKKQQEAAMHKLTLDGVTFETDNLQLVQAVEREIARKDTAIQTATGERDSAKADLEKANARADAAEKDRDEAIKAREDAADPANVRKLVDARLGLERTAEPLLREQLKKDSKKIESMDDGEIKARVIALHDPDVNLDGKDPVYVDARYDAAIVSLAKRQDSAADRSRRAVEEHIASPQGEGTKPDPAAQYKKDSQEAWKKDLHVKN